MHDNTVKYKIAPDATFVKIHVAQNYIVTSLPTFDATKYSAAANDPTSTVPGDAGNGKAKYDQAIPTGTKLVLYELKSGMSDDGVDTSYQKVQISGHDAT